MKDEKKPPTESWSPKKLRDHPQQAVIFGDLPEAEFEAFVADIKEKGMRVPPEILLDGTVIVGHQRVRADGGPYVPGVIERLAASANRKAVSAYHDTKGVRN